MDSHFHNENIATEYLNNQANMVESYDEAMDIIKEYKDIIKKTKRT